MLNLSATGVQLRRQPWAFFTAEPVLVSLDGVVALSSGRPDRTKG